MNRLDKYRKILTRYWGYTSFRPLQEDILKSIGQGYDTLGLMPTGGGKSITFQIPAIASDGICIVITPLIALMKDQVDKLKKMDIRAMAIHSGMTREEIDIAFDNCIYGDYKFLYISPERIRSEIFEKRVRAMNVVLVAVDEAHCISKWGYDFRPSYLHIAGIRKLVGKDVPMLALTATATSRVVEDIMDKLEFRQKNVLKSGFERKNLVYLVRKVEDKNKYILETLQKVKASGIIYVRNRKKTREIAQFLVSNKISADYYHAGLNAEQREYKQNAWTTGKPRIIVATNAFGMGIDKADVRFVIHWDIPDSIESYFQESGRAGRDGKKAWAVQIFYESDIGRAKERVNRKFPPVDYIKNIYELLCNYLQIPIGSGKNVVYDFNLAEFVSRYRLSVAQAYNSLKFLERENYIELTEELNNPSRVFFKASRDDLYKFQVANASLDSFIKLLLRNYTGLFSEYVPVNEDILARKSGLSRDIIYKYFVDLSSRDIINYIPGKRTALIIFTEERLDRKSLYISPENHRDVMNKYLERLDEMIKYVNSKSKCRASMLLDYFGQESVRCGMCDVCMSRNELDMSKYEFDLILDKIKEMLQKEGMTAEQVMERLDAEKENAVKVIRWLLDHDKILKDNTENLIWNS
ncbi:MAG TPA: RecQ family ATP-dependent DNA helicase [Bacteroidales bacterium]|nr:RecQ family ATP-dependent DNA helicase [Bacteroidales bacterium]